MWERSIADEQVPPEPPTLGALIEQHYPRLIRLAGLILRSSLDAEDAVQNGLERAWKHRRDVRENSSVVKWLDRIVVREAIRARRRWSLPYERKEAFVPEPPVDLIELDVALGALPAEQRAAVVLHHWSGYSLAETAEIMGTSVETARSRLRLARDKLRKAFQDGSRDRQP